MDNALHAVSRMDRIQAPIVAVVGDWIRQTPGTISLGQGVVHYGPPAAALDAVRAALGSPATHEYRHWSSVWRTSCAPRTAPTPMSDDA